MAPYHLRRHPKKTETGTEYFANKAERSSMDPLHVQNSYRANIGFEEEASGSDVSASTSGVESSAYLAQQSLGERDHISGPAPDAKTQLQPESLSAIKRRLIDLDAVEDALVSERNKLLAKRKRKDERIRNRLEEEDQRVKRQRDEEDARRYQKRAIMRDRICKRREREDLEYRNREKAHDDEENELRRRRKNLKRGLPADDEATGTRRTSTLSESMSPPLKKHQPNPAPNPPLDSPSRPVALEPQQSQQSQRPQQAHQVHQMHQVQQVQQIQQLQQPQQLPARYPMYYSWNPPPTGPYAYGPGHTYQLQNRPNPPQQDSLPPLQVPNGGILRSSLPHPPPPPKNRPSPQGTPQSSHAQPPAPPPAQSQYDVRPPSTVVSFSSINGPRSGFPSINQPPPHSVGTPFQTDSKVKRVTQPSAKVHALEPAGHHSPPQVSGSSPSVTTPVLAGKRKASTTHPYSQSEAFANRHHHCERTDELDRGIWTYFGPGGTKEAPTVAGKREMYLKCTHDGCMRLDWKTVHGLQCHIVKSHGVAKGTIGSLDLALEKYGVEAQEVEEYERQYGLGSAGATGLRMLKQPRSSNETDRPMSAGTASGPTSGSPAKYGSSVRPRPAAGVVLFPNLKSRSPNGGYVQDDIVYSEDESDGEGQSDEVKRQTARNITSAAQWRGSELAPSTPLASQAGQDDGHKEPVPDSDPSFQARSYGHEAFNYPNARPTSSTETLAVVGSAPASTENFPLQPAKSPLDPTTQTQTPPLGTETQKIASAVERVNARLEAKDPDFEATASTAESEVPTQTQTQTPTQTPAQTPTQAQSQLEETQTAATSNNSTKPHSSSTSRPRAGAERRVRVSERWDWVPIADDADDDNADESTNAGENARSGGFHHGRDGVKRKDGSTGRTALTKAQQELQGIDADGATVETGGDKVAEQQEEDDEEDEEEGGNMNLNMNLTSPTTSRYNVRKKTRRRVDV